MKARVEANICMAYECGQCLARQECVRRAIIWLEPEAPAIVQETTCDGCGDCLPACPAGAISLR